MNSSIKKNQFQVYFLLFLLLFQEYRMLVLHDISGALFTY